MRLKIVIVLVLLICLLFPLPASAGDKWQGTDDLVDRKMVELTGSGAGTPLIDISQGNLGLFLFAVGGFAAGIVVGYQWRKVFGEKAGKSHD